jgi:hypothetical protein
MNACGGSLQRPCPSQPAHIALDQRPVTRRKTRLLSARASVSIVVGVGKTDQLAGQLS